MRRLRPLLVLLLWVPIATGCGDMFDLDINTDPDAATEVQGDLLLPTALVAVATERQIEIGPPNALNAQVWASNGSTGVFTDPERYRISSFTAGNFWGIVYDDGIKNMTLMRDQALAEDPQQVNVAAQAEILISYYYWILTSIWETVPFTQALNGAEFPEPAFDDQETILRGLVERLDAAVAMIDQGSPGVQGGDLVYGGNMANWERFGNSLKLRILMMIRNEDPSVDSQIQTLLSQPLIRENSQEAAVPFFTTPGNENPVWKLNNLYGGFTDVQNGNGFLYAGEPLVDLMKDLDDPRLSTYFELAVDDQGEYNTDEYFGQTAGVFDYYDETSMISQNIFRRDWPARMVTAAEVWFYEAEILSSTSGAAAAEAAFETGVRRAIDWFDGKPGAISEAAEEAYVAALPPATLDAIHGQQYIEVFDRGPENWTQWRRTHYPDLPVPEQAVLTGIIRRYPFPTDEIASNPNTPAQIPLDRPMWFEPGN